MIRRSDVLSKAELCVCTDRENAYGSPEDNFSTIAKMWSLYKNIDFSAEDVAIMMILLKVSRLRGGGTLDSFVDIAGYAACGGELWGAIHRGEKDISVDVE